MLKSLSRSFRIVLTIFLLAACGTGPVPIPGPAIQPISASPTLTAFQPSSTTPTQTLPPPTEIASPTLTPRPVAGRVLIISIDGLRPDAIALAPMPNLLELMQSGAYSLNAQTIFPSATLPAHASMLSGICPAQHGVNWNDYLPEKGFAKGTSLFALAKRAGLYTVMIVGKNKLRQLTPPDTTDIFQFINDRDVVLADLAAPTLKKGFDLAFMHLATTDDMGHAYGWLSPQQISVIRRADEAIGTILSALDEAGLRRDTLIIFTADHGGHEQAHGSRRPEDMTIPWIINGPGVIAQTIALPVNTTDTAATAAWALHLSPPADWVGRPIREAFGELPTLRAEPRCP
jgi:arylsulfatase A-like enzyme